MLEAKIEDGRNLCLFCEHAFEPKNDQQRFCKDNCRKAFHKAGGIGARQRRIIAEVVREIVRETLKEMGIGVAA